MTYRILVTGSRDFDDYGAITAAMVRVVQAEIARRRTTTTEWVTVVHGACPTGADALADTFAFNVCNWNVERHPADWDTFRKSAGPRRNAEMVNLGADICLAFIRDNSRGASHTLGLAERAGIPSMRMDYLERRCGDCGCTDRYGCPQGCGWVAGAHPGFPEEAHVGICSVCAKLRVAAAFDPDLRIFG